MNEYPASRSGRGRWVARPVVKSLLFSCALMLAACGGAPKKPDTIKLQVTIRAASDVNPDSTGRPSPVVVALYQLASIEAFENGDFFSVFDESGATLGDSLLKRDQFVVKPEEVREFEAEFDPETAFVGAVAAFRNIESATWRAFIEVPEKSMKEKINVFSKNRLNIVVDTLAVSLAE